MHVQLYVTHFKRKDYGELLEIYEILQSVSKQVLERAGHIKKVPSGVLPLSHNTHKRTCTVSTYTYITFRHMEGHALM